MSQWLDAVHEYVRSQEWQRQQRMIAEARANDPERKLGRAIWSDRELAEWRAKNDAECGGRYDG